MPHNMLKLVELDIPEPQPTHHLLTVAEAAVLSGMDGEYRPEIAIYPACPSLVLSSPFNLDISTLSLLTFLDEPWLPKPCPPQHVHCVHLSWSLVLSFPAVGLVRRVEEVALGSVDLAVDEDFPWPSWPQPPNAWLQNLLLLQKPVGIKDFYSIDCTTWHPRGCQGLLQSALGSALELRSGFSMCSAASLPLFPNLPCLGPASRPHLTFDPGGCALRGEDCGGGKTETIHPHRCPTFDARPHPLLHMPLAPDPGWADKCQVPRQTLRPAAYNHARRSFSVVLYEVSTARQRRKHVREGRGGHKGVVSNGQGSPPASGTAHAPFLIVLPDPSSTKVFTNPPNYGQFVPKIKRWVVEKVHLLMVLNSSSHQSSGALGVLRSLRRCCFTVGSSSSSLWLLELRSSTQLRKKFSSSFF
ncbi:hypothetical protein MHYP_G00048840 [Metynnis hypsauchen]